MCGIFGIENNINSSTLAFAGLITLQHRGEESAGITSNGDGDIYNTHKSMGLVSQIFKEKILNTLTGKVSIGHVRYSTHSESTLLNAQPFDFNCIHGNIAVAHNGNITNFEKIKDRLAKSGSIFNHTSDTEIVAHLIAENTGKTIGQIIRKSLQSLEGAFSLLFIHKNKLIGVRDSFGFRPLALGKVENSYILASETSAIDAIGGKFIRDIKPGEIIVIENGKIAESLQLVKETKEKLCIFEQVYFSRPDSILCGRNIKDARVDMGKYLALQMKHIKADVVVPVPDTGIFSAQGFSQASGIELQIGFIRNHYVGRSFIKPSQKMREITAKLKLFPIKDVINGKRIVLIDDSLVRGTTAQKIVRMLRNVGAKEIHLALSSPAVISPCFYGIDTPIKSKLIASLKSIEEIRNFLNVDSLTFLNIENMKKACGNGRPNNFCSACFDGKYPSKIDKKKLNA
ncbi:MAG: amidophosphoribosyltransferase [Endomicrobiaceae bacterium]|nr:amidophosphoribosyltransferase [Endomicrobiaceae bacterium]